MVKALAFVVGLSLAACSPVIAAPYKMSIIGEIDGDTLKGVVADLNKARAEGAERVVLDIVSPGGGGSAALAIVQEFQQASKEGIIVEMHAHSLCASACTFILGSGTKGFRFIQEKTMFLVHGMQGATGCIPMKDNPTSIEDRALMVEYDLIIDTYVEETGQSREVVKKWVTCGNEQVGKGDLAVKLGLADAVEK